MAELQTGNRGGGGAAVIDRLSGGDENFDRWANEGIEQAEAYLRGIAAVRSAHRGDLLTQFQPLGGVEPVVGGRAVAFAADIHLS